MQIKSVLKMTRLVELNRSTLMYTVWMGGEFGGEWTDMCICVAESESFRCSPETVTTLLIGYTPIQNKKFKEKRRKPNSNKKSTLTTKSTDSSVLGA